MSDHDEIVTVYTVKDEMEGEIIKNALEDEGIMCNLGGEHQAGLTGTFDVDILVRAEDEARAREIIESHLEKD
ncbi:MAG: DUF2007 domain-containing protein [Pirellulales bacterium]|nr:DUF2007 domain-containing protein [Pirellulales bacterium]